MKSLGSTARPSQGWCAEVSGMRFLVLVLFTAFGFINQIQYVAFSTIVRETQAYYSVNAFAVNALSLIIPLLYCVCVFPGSLLYIRLGLRYGMIAGAGVNAFGAFLKFIAVWAPKYPLLVVAQVMVALGQVLFLGLPPLVVSTWFPVEERTLATAIATLFGFVGMAVGMFYPPHIISLPDRNTPRRWGGSMGFHFGFSVLVAALIAAVVRDKPKSPPSITAAKLQPDSVFAALKRQLQNRDILLLAISFGMVAGLLSALAAVLTQFVEPMGVTEPKAAILAFSGLLGGAVNCALIGHLVDRVRCYKRALIGLIASVVVFLLPIVIMLVKVQNKSILSVLAYVLVPIVECLVLPTFPVAMELSVELTYPDSESISTNLILFSMCFFSFLGMVVFSIILGDHPSLKSAFIVSLIALVASVLSLGGVCLLRADLHRYTVEKGGDECEPVTACQMEA